MDETKGAGAKGTTGDPPRRPARGSGERRPYLTVLFSDLSGSTRLGHETDPEILDEVLQHVKEAAFRVVARHHGTVAQFHGDGVLAVFGHPTQHEDDVRRAANAALELHAEIRALDLAHLVPRDFEVRMHSGIDAGLVLVREGDAVTGHLELVGQAPNTAAGLASRAGRDEILASRHTLDGSLPYFVTTEAPPVELKGVDEPIEVCRIEGRTGVRTRFEASRLSGLTPFVGREDALRVLARCLDRARAGRLARALVVGDAGLGKTRTIEEFLARVRSNRVRVLAGVCEQEGDVAPMLPFRQILRSALGLALDTTRPPSPGTLDERFEGLGVAEHARALLDLLGVAAQDAEGGAVRPAAPAPVAPALAALLSALARDTPLVLFIDDWQWSDDASRTLASALRGPLANAPILWLLASRPNAGTDTIHDDEERIALEPFRALESANAIEALSPRGLDLGVAERLHHRSGGNPLFLEELCRSIEREESAAGPRSDVPPTLHGLIQSRFLALPEIEASVLRAAAVIGNVVPEWLLAAVSPAAGDDAVRQLLETEDLLHPGAVPGTLRFKHGITRDVVYHSVRLSERRRLHAAIAAELEASFADRAQERPLETLAYHYEGAADFARAADFAEAAGDRAWASSALDRTRLQYGAALRALDRLEPSEANQRRWLAISRRRAFACVYDPAPEQIEMLEKAARLGAELGDADAVGHAHFWSGFISYSLGNMADSIAAYQRGLAAAKEAGDPKLIAQLRANLGQSQAAAGDYARASGILDASLEMKRKLSAARPGSRAPTGFAYGIAAKGFVAAERGETAEAIALFEEALELVDPTGHPVAGSCAAFQSAGYVLLGRLEQLLPIARRVASDGERMNGPFLVGRGRCDGAYARYMLTGDVEALAPLSATATWLDDKEIRLFLSLAHGCAAEAFARAGRFDEAKRHARRTLRRAEELDVIGEGMACRALARVMARESRDEPERALDYLTRAIEAAERRGSRREIALCQLTHADLLAERGEDDEARRVLARALPALEAMALDWPVAQANGLATRLGGL